MRTSILAIPLLGLAGLGLAACQDTDQPLTEESAAICDSINDSITELQKRHSSELGEAVLMNQMRSQGQLPDENLDPAALAQFALLHYEAQLSNMLLILDGNGCALPTEPVDGRIYSQAAGRCLQARASGIGDVEAACNRESWEPNAAPAEEVDVTPDVEAEEDAPADG
ncbi:hypothetical protein [Aurantiacibacter gangjinensis]|uniref:Uncharacterized protein n=1 Tax=Aurantiacibacter gangjinensis TaxID=502682 RepID=A0A0G9MTQ1_9SPHN|nr:hypothetical protein [Aurantiacibacter gangjinensis]APE28457.1 hypothetical protein BMF35_a1628 [Aurantiacibacter gangjinensis]KLE32668.1 hypothetical protein AAW01_01010 [Aurantiacibacter gangjinensis]